MARSKKILLSICAVLITCVMCTVSAFAYGSGGDADVEYEGNDGYFVPTVPFDLAVFEYHTPTGTEYMNMPLVTSYMAESLPYWGKNSMVSYGDFSDTSFTEFEFRITSIEFINSNYGRMVRWDTPNLDYDHWGVEVGQYKVLPITLSARDFWVGTAQFTNTIYEDNFPTFSYANTWGYQGDIVMRGQISGLIWRDTVSNGTTIRRPVEYTREFTNRNQSFDSRNNLFLTRDELYDIIDSDSSITEAEKNQLKSSSQIHFDWFSVDFEIPINDDVDTYQYTVNQPFRNNSQTQSGVSWNSPFIEWVRRNISPYINSIQYEDLNFMELMVNNMNSILGLQIFGGLTLGGILWLCVGIGMLFAILKFFAGG